MEPRTLFGETPPIKLFFTASLPGAVSMLASALYQLLDGMMVGQILGETPFAALNLAMPFVIINFALADLIGVGSSVPIAMNLGKKKEEEANNIFSCACLMIFAAGVVIGALLYAGAPLLMRLMRAEGQLLSDAVSYLRVYALCSPLTTIVFAMDNYLRICGKIRFSMFLNILMSVIIAGLEFIFLYYFRFGIWSAALATCIGMAACALAALLRFPGGRLQLRFRKPRFSKNMIKQIISCGSPNFLNNIAGRITSILLNTILLRVGGQTAVSVYGILMYVEGFIQPLLYGMCDSLQPAVSFNWGAGDLKRVKAIERCCFTASAIVSLVSALVIFVFPGQLAVIFIGETASSYFAMAVTALRLFALTYLTRWFSFAVQSYMLAVGNAAGATLISLSAALLFPVILIVSLWPFGLTGIWLNFAGTSLLAGVLAAFVMTRFQRNSRSDRYASADSN